MNGGFWGATKPPPGATLASPATPGGLAGCWPMLEGAGRSVADLGSLKQSGWLDDDTRVHADWVRGGYGSAVRLSESGANNNGVRLPVGAIGRILTGAPGATICTRVFLTAASSSTTFAGGVCTWLINGGSSNGGYCGFSSTNNSPWMQGRSQSGDGSQTKTSARTLSLGRWYSVAYLYDYVGDRINIAVDGVLEAWTSVTFGATAYTPASPSANDELGDIAGAGNSGSINGYLEYVYLFRRVLTPTELANITARPYSIFAPPVWRRYKVGGTVQTQSLAGTMTSAGALVFQPIKAIAGTLTDSGTLIKQPSKIVVGTLSSAGALSKQANKVPAGTLTSSGALTPNVIRALSLAGTMTSAGALVKQANKALAGTLTSAGALVKQPAKALAGTLTMAGSLTKQAQTMLAGTLSSSGALAKAAQKPLAGSLTTAGAIVRQANKACAGALTTAGQIQWSLARTLAGTLPSSGALARVVQKPLAGALTTAGAITRQVNTLLTGALTTAGALSKQANKLMSGTLTTAGALSNTFISGVGTVYDISVGGTLATAGVLKNIAQKLLAGTLLTSGAVIHQAKKMLAGTLATAGALHHDLARLLSGTLTTSGMLRRPSALYTNLISYWKLDESSGDALDAHGSNTLTDTNTVGSATGLISGARDFERDTAQYFTHASSAGLTTGDIDFTVAAWIKLESGANGSTRTIVGKNSLTDHEFELAMLQTAGSRKLILSVNDSGGSNTTLTSTDVMALGTWYFVVGWHDSVNNELGVSINDVSKTQSYSGGIGTSPTGSWYIGSEAHSHHFDGLIDEVGFWKRVLTSGERTQLYNGGLGLAYPFAGVWLVSKIMSGVAATAGAITKRDVTLGIGSGLSGAILPYNTLVLQVRKTFAGALTSSGALTVLRTSFLTVAGTLTTAGAILSKQVQKRLSGTLPTSGSVRWLLSRTLSGGLGLAGALGRRLPQALSGILSTVGSLITQLLQNIPGIGVGNVAAVEPPTGTLASVSITGSIGPAESPVGSLSMASITGDMSPLAAPDSGLSPSDATGGLDPEG